MGANLGAHPGERLPTRANWFGQASGDHASLRPIRTMLNA